MGEAMESAWLVLSIGCLSVLLICITAIVVKLMMRFLINK